MSFQPYRIQVDSLDEVLKYAKDLYFQVMSHKIVLFNLKESLEVDSLLEFCKKVSGKESFEKAFIKWEFGFVLNLVNQVKSNNYILSNEKVPLHWDGAFNEVPSILVFNCVKSTFSGGDTIFVDTESILENLNKDQIEKLAKIKFRYITQKLAHYGGCFEQQLVEVHPFTKKSVLRIGEEVKTLKNPVKRELIYKEHRKYLEFLDRLLSEDAFHYKHKWSKGDLLLADNHSLLHGRDEILSLSGERELHRVQIK